MTAARCALRPYRETDRDAVDRLFGDASVMRFVGDGLPMTPAESVVTIDRIFGKYRTDPAFFIWAIEEAGEYAGHAELKRRGGRSEYELVYILDRARWGKGLGGEVADLLIADARRKGIPFVIATVDAGNAASIAILERRGFARDEPFSRELETPAFRLALDPQSPRGD